MFYYYRHINEWLPMQCKVPILHNSKLITIYTKLMKINKAKEESRLSTRNLKTFGLITLIAHWKISKFGELWS